MFIIKILFCKKKRILEHLLKSGWILIGRWMQDMKDRIDRA